MELRTGLGFDVHRLAPGRRLVLGGVQIAHPLGLLGHSDADVVLHALCDAMLGAAGLGDIGELFPDTDPVHRDRDSADFVAEVLRRVHDRGWKLQNVDLVIAAEQPKIKPHRAAMRTRLAALLGLPEDAVGLKAGTHEGLDSIGRGLAIACWANVLLLR